MKTPPAGDFSNILAGLTDDGRPAAPTSTPRLGRPAALARQAKAPARTAPPAAATNRPGKDDDRFDKLLRDRNSNDRPAGKKVRDGSDPGRSAGGKPQAGLHRRFLAFSWREAIRLLRWREPKAAPEKTPRAEPAAPGERPRSRFLRLFRVRAWSMPRSMPWFIPGSVSWSKPWTKPWSKPGSRRKGFFFSRRADPQEPASGPARASRRDARAPEFRLPRTEDEAIAAELGLRADLASGDLRKIRREFAKKNHPDRIAAPQRMSAARRMSIANMLIDEHLKKQPGAR